MGFIRNYLRSVSIKLKKVYKNSMFLIAPGNTGSTDKLTYKKTNLNPIQYYKNTLRIL